MKNFFIYPNMRKDGARAVLPDVCARLHRQGVRLMLPLQMRNVPLDLPGVDYMEPDAAIRLADLAVVLGGMGRCCVSRASRRCMRCLCSASMSVMSAL